MEELCKDVKVVPKIKEIKITNEGIIKKADIKFKEGLNIITGKNATGKTTLIKAIEKQSLNVWSIEDLIRNSQNDKIMLLFYGIAGISLNKCFLIDNLSKYSDQKLNKFLERLAESKNQIIITLADTVNIPKIKAKIIDTESFELMKHSGKMSNNKFKVGDNVKVFLSENDYDYKKWNGFESKITDIVDMGHGEPQYELKGCPNLAWQGKNLIMIKDSKSVYKNR